MESTNGRECRKKFKAKKRWWAWALAALMHMIVVRFWIAEIYLVPVAAIIIDLVLLPDVTHMSYVIDDKFLTIRTIFYPIYPSDDIPLHMITSITKTTLMTFPGFGVYLNEDSLGAFKIVYSEKRGKTKSVIISPKNRLDFMEAIECGVDKSAILIDNRESAFKKKKDSQ
ncbi:MAG: PH domain-containing protein [Oscillospiraceae bacterium]|nr:PH domain-containing protein [Oscillospiraceae bacterium]